MVISLENNSNVITALELDNGVLYVKDTATEDFIETLIEKGILWEFLSSLLMDYVKGGKHNSLVDSLIETDEVINNMKHLKEVAETSKSLESQVNLLGNQMSDILNKISALSGNVQIVSNNTQLPNVGTVAPTETVVVKKKKVASKPPKTKAGGFAALAKKASAFERK